MGDVFKVMYKNEKYDAKVLMWEVGDSPSHIWKIDEKRPRLKGTSWKETQNTDLRRHLNDCLEKGLDKIPDFQKYNENDEFVSGHHFKLLNLQNFAIDEKENTFSFTPTHSKACLLYTSPSPRDRG